MKEKQGKSLDDCLPDVRISIIIRICNGCTVRTNVNNYALPVTAIALGADHDPSANLATTRPVPILPVKRNPTFATVKKAIPLAPSSSSRGMESFLPPVRALSVVKFRRV